MSIPTINVDEVSAGNIGIYNAMQIALPTLGNTTLAFFLALVPERGSKLFERLRKYQAETGGKTVFTDFVIATVKENVAKVIFPRECILDPDTRSFLIHDIQCAVRSYQTDNEMIIGIYFGVGRAYEAARRISCKGCPHRKCRHHIGM